jgi:predicted protein tyrosine phosphatase
MSFFMSFDDVTLVSDRLFLTSVDAVRDVDRMQQLGVTHIISVLNQRHLPPRTWSLELDARKIKHMMFELDDCDDPNLADILHATQLALRRIHRASPLHVVVIHCQLGVSRSATCVLNYWLNENPLLGADAALHTLQQLRPCAQPNFWFMEKLRTMYSDTTRSR